MAQENKRLRLDQILIEEGLINEDQLMNALSHQKRRGGRIGMHLLLLGYIDEEGLVKALARQAGCKGIVLADLEIPKEVLKFIPTKVAIARSILPFDYNPEDNTLKVACETPHDTELMQEISFLTHGKQVKLFVASELSLINAISKFYLGLEVTEDNPFLEIPPLEFDATRQPAPPKEPEPVRKSASVHKAALIVSDDKESTMSLSTMLKQDNYTVLAKYSVDEALDILDDHQFEAAFIKDTSPGNYLELIDRMRKNSPKTQVRYFASVSELILSNKHFPDEAKLAVKNLELFTALIDSVDNVITSSGRIGSYVDRLCQKMQIQAKDRLIITNAAYLCDLAQHYYSGKDLFEDRKSAIAATIRLLDSMSYPPMVTGILRTMYMDLKKKYTTRLPVEVLGGNIITIVDHFIETQIGGERLSIDKLEAAKRGFLLLEGKLFLKDIMDAFFDMLQDEVLDPSSKQKHRQVLLYAADIDDLQLLENRLDTAGFRTISESDCDGFLELYIRSLPDTIVLYCAGDADSTITLLDELSGRGVKLDKIPTFVLTSGELVTKPQRLLDKGITEVLPIHDRINLLVVRLNKVRESAAEDSDFNRTEAKEAAADISSSL